MKLWIAAACMTVFALPAHAQKAQTQWLMDWCQNDRPMLAAYMTGMLDYSIAVRMMDKQVGREIAPTFCVPTGVQMGDIASAFCTYAAANPDRVKWPAGLLVHSAMHAKFPCK